MKYIFIICFALSGSGVIAQKVTVKHLHVHLLAKSYQDSIVLRWAPTDPVAWLLGKDSGYRIARIDYSDRQHPVTTTLTPAPLRPLTLEQMMATIGPNNKYAAIAAQALYGKDFQMTKDAPHGFAKQVKQAHDALNFRYSFTLQAADLSPIVAGAIALRWVDKDVKKGGSYIYVVTVCATGKEYIVDSAAAFVANIPAAPVSAPTGLTAFGFDRQTELHWNRRQTGNFDAYDIQRSDNDGKTWATLNKVPYFSPDELPKPAPGTHTKKDTTIRKIATLLRDHQLYVDSLPQDYHRYYYRIRGTNAFAEWSAWSEPVAVEGHDLTPPIAPMIDSVRNSYGTRLDITWSQHNQSPDLAGYYISRANSVKGPFYPITKYMLPKGIHRFTDSAAVAHLPNYYVVVAVDTAKNVAASAAFPGYLTDTLPPAAPTRIAGTIDSSGIVRLHWAANHESDLQGYKVYFAYGAHDQFAQLTHHTLTDTSFTDTISMHSLNRSVWYSVVAVDNSNNHSAYSTPAQLKKPVVVPPSPPVAGDITVNAHQVAIQWIQSRSQGAAGYEIARKTNDKEYKTITRLSQDWNKRALKFTDTTVSANTDYYYVARTIDSTGSHSPWSVAVHAVYHAADSLAAPTGLQASFDSKQHRVRLSWKYNDTGDYFFIVYRGVDKGALAAWHSFDKTITSGEDVQAAGGQYAYAIRVVHRDRTSSSSMSKPIHITIP